MSTQPTLQNAAAMSVAPSRSWIARLAAMVSLTKPRLSLLVLFTAAAGFYLGSTGSLNVLLLFHTIVATAMVAGGACALNQYLERDADALMKRTASRPIPTGRLSPEESLVFGAAISIVGMLYLALAANVLAACLAALTLLLYLLIYTPLKRVTPLCLPAGAIPGAMPPLIGYAAACGALTYQAWLPFLIIFFWQHPHFLAISWLYREDYARGGFAMLSVVDHDGRAVARQTVSRTIALLVFTLLPAATGMAGPAYGITAIVSGLGFGACVAGMAIRRDSASARRVFFASLVYLPVLLGMLVWDATR